MNTEILCIKTINESVNLTAQQNIDADIILPDYYDTIGKILKSEICPVAEAVTASGDKISIAGIAKFSLLYMGEDNKMYCYENEYRYTKVFQSQFAEKCLAFKVNQTVFSLNSRAIAPKRIELRAVLQIGVRLVEENSKELISAVDDGSVIVKNENISYISTVNFVTRSFSLSSSFSLADFSDKIDIIIRKSSRIKLSEIKTIHNKAYIKGLAETEILYFSNESGCASSTVLSVPVSEVIDIFGAEDNDECRVQINDVFTDIILKNNDTDNSALEIRLDVNLQAEITRKISCNVISDAYSINKDLQTVKDAADLAVSRNKISKTESIVLEADLYDESRFSVVDCWVNNLKISSEQHGNRNNILLSLMFNAFINNEDGKLMVLSREHTVESYFVADGSDVNFSQLSCDVLSVTALQLPTGKIRFLTEINIEADVSNICKVSGFTEIDICDEDRCDTSSKYIVYFARQNEDIWSVAKDNKTSVETIKTVNDLSGDTLIEDKMLILPSF